MREVEVMAFNRLLKGRFQPSEDARVTEWCAGADERWAWRWFEHLDRTGAVCVMVRRRADRALAVFRVGGVRDARLLEDLS